MDSRFRSTVHFFHLSAGDRRRRSFFDGQVGSTIKRKMGRYFAVGSYERDKSSEETQKFQFRDTLTNFYSYLQYLPWRFIFKSKPAVFHTTKKLSSAKLSVLWNAVICLPLSAPLSSFPPFFFEQGRPNPSGAELQALIMADNMPRPEDFFALSF
uniref:Uncharacterized protein n=1 Tax=Romanomermis culicivorax TaxID=13658 RepID=A0A915I7R9_ROMCU